MTELEKLEDIPRYVIEKTKKYYIIDKSGNRQYKKYCDCGKMIAYASVRCLRCSGKHRSKLNADKRRENAGL